MMESMIHQWRAHFELVCTEKKINIKHKQRIEHKKPVRESSPMASHKQNIQKYRTKNFILSFTQKFYLKNTRKRVPEEKNVLRDIIEGLSPSSYVLQAVSFEQKENLQI